MTEKSRIRTRWHDYDVVIGSHLFTDPSFDLQSYFDLWNLDSENTAFFFIEDENIEASIRDEVVANIARHANICNRLPINGGEPVKNWQQLQNVTEWLLDKQIERKDLIFALGGGTIGDLVGFAAGIVKRGVRYVQLPTTLLSMVDSSVGGKTAINSGAGKNLVGLFNPPIAVFADLSLLELLPTREIRAGMAEVLKYGLISDPQFFQSCAEDCSKLLLLDPGALSNSVYFSVQSKAAIVEQDELEGHKRALLNLGHSFGHALEAAAKEKKADLLHGEAIAAGMAMAARFSAIHFGMPADEVKQIEKTLTLFGLPTACSQCAGAPFEPSTLLHYMRQDKKNENNMITLILLKNIGHAFIEKKVDCDKLAQFLEQEADQRP